MAGLPRRLRLLAMTYYWAVNSASGLRLGGNLTKARGRLGSPLPINRDMKLPVEDGLSCRNARMIGPEMPIAKLAKAFRY